MIPQLDNVAELLKQAQEACQARVWTHSVGIINTIRDVDQKRRIDEETMGTGSLGRWGNHYFIQTADHVIHPDAKPSDLRLFWRPSGSDQYVPDSQLRPEDIVNGTAIKDQKAAIRRCEWDDLAIVTIDPSEAGPYSEFIDMSKDGIDPAAGEPIHVFGYPIDRHIVVGSQDVSPTRKEVTIAIRPDIFSGNVLLHPNFAASGFDPERHYLVPYDHPSSEHPRGFSGAAAWWEPPDLQQVWRPNYKFAGICTHCYERKNPIVERIVKASAVRKFLREVLGPAGGPLQTST